MEQCNLLGCTKKAEIEHTIGADISMTCTMSNSTQVTKVCKDCAEMLERTKNFARSTVANMLA